VGFWLKVELFGLANGPQDHVVLVVRSYRNIRVGDVWDASDGIVKRFFRLLEGLVQRGNLVAKDAHGADLFFALFLAFHPADFLADGITFRFLGFNVDDQSATLLIKSDDFIHDTGIHLTFCQGFFYEFGIIPE